MRGDHRTLHVLPHSVPTRLSSDLSAPGDGIRLADVDPALLQVKDDLELPIIGADGRQPWSAYGRPFNVDDSRPRVAVVMVGLGLGRQVTERAIAELPGAISRSEEHTSELQSLMRISYAVFCLKKQKQKHE